MTGATAFFSAVAFPSPFGSSFLPSFGASASASFTSSLRGAKGEGRLACSVMAWGRTILLTVKERSSWPRVGATSRSERTKRCFPSASKTGSPLS